MIMIIFFAVHHFPEIPLEMVEEIATHLIENTDINNPEELIFQETDIYDNYYNYNVYEYYNDYINKLGTVNSTEEQV